MKKLVGMMLLALMIGASAKAKVRLPHLVGDNMVLQQQTDARLWGWADAGKTVRVTVSWNNDTYTAKADSQGKWMVTVKTPDASFTPLSITFDDGDKTTINNVLSGEVWVCAGQSNMEMPTSRGLTTVLWMIITRWWQMPLIHLVSVMQRYQALCA